MLVALELPPAGKALSKEATRPKGSRCRDQTPPFRDGTLPTPARGQGRRTGPGTYFPNAVFAEVFVVAENDDFAGHGCTDAEPVLNLKSDWRKRERRKKGISGVYTDSAKLGKEHQPRAGSLSLGTSFWTRHLSMERCCSVLHRIFSSNPGPYLVDANGTMASYDKEKCL